jgi:transglutaminase-like putative cysteine protease
VNVEAQRQAVITANAKAIRVSLIIGGLLAQLAVQPLVGSPVWVSGSVLLSAAGIFSARLPLHGDATAPERTLAGGRQFVAIAFVVAFGLGALYSFYTEEPRAETLALLLIGAQLAHTVAMRTLREAALGCGVTMAMLAVAAVFASDAALAVLLVGGFACTGGAATLIRRATLIESATAAALERPGAAVWRALMPFGVAIVVGAIGFTLLAHSAPLHPHHRGGAGGVAGNAGHGTTPRTVQGYFASGALDLRTRGDLPTTTILSTDSAAPPYWQGAIYDSFDGLTWKMPLPNPSGVWNTADDGTQVPPNASSPGIERNDDVDILVNTGSTVVFAPGVVTSYRGLGRVFSDVDGSPRVAGAPIGRYEVASVVLAPSADQLHATSGADIDDPKWTALPASIAPRVTDLARDLTSSSQTRYDKVRAIENYLKTHEKYDLHSPQPQAGDDAVDDFVFVSHRGFCEQFATAAVVMLRGVGVPARLVTGFAFGDTTSEPGRRVFRGSDAHAWVQVYYPGIGWVASDPTGTAVATSRGSSARQQVSAFLLRLWHALLSWGGALVVLAIVVLVVFVALWRRRRIRTAPDPRAAAGPVLRAYLALDAALVDTGRAREPNETLAEFARRLGGLIATSSEVAAAMHCLERECYARSSRRPSDAEIAAAVEVFERLRTAAGSHAVVLIRSG